MDLDASIGSGIVVREFPMFLKSTDYVLDLLNRYMELTPFNEMSGLIKMHNVFGDGYEKLLKNLN